MPLASLSKSRNLTLCFIRIFLGAICFGIPGLFIDTDILHAQEATLIAEFDANVTIHQVLWSPDGELIAVATDNGTLILDQNLTLITTLHGHRGNVSYAVAWSPDGFQLATGGDGDKDGLIVWDRDKTTNDFTVNRTLSPSRGNVRALAWSPDGQNLVVMSKVFNPNAIYAVLDIWNTTEIWELETIPNYQYIEPTFILSWSFDNRFIALGGRQSCSPDTTGGTCAYSGQVGVVIFDLEVRDVVNVIRPFDRSFNFEWSPVSIQIASQYNQYVLIYDGITGERLRNIPQHFWDFDWSVDGEQIAGIFTDSFIFRDVVSGEIDIEIPVNDRQFRHSSLDSSKFAIASDTGLIQVWRLVGL